MKLEDLPDGTRILVDANILIYHFSGYRWNVERFSNGVSPGRSSVYRCAHRAGSTHRLMILEALQKGLITGGQPARKLQEQPEIIKVLQEYNQSVQHIPVLISA